MQIPFGQKALSIEEIRELDRLAAEVYAMPGLLLMEHAGTGIYDILRPFCCRKQSLILCGKGNNGGDGMVIARHLFNAGEKVSIVFADDPKSIKGDAAIQFRMIERLGVPFFVSGSASVEVMHNLFQTADVLVDGLLGSGLKSTVREPYSSLITLFNAASGFKVAVDIPSGIDGDSGEVLGVAVQANLTITLGAWKKCFVSGVIDGFSGEVQMVEIGLPRPLRERTVNSP